MVRNLGSRGRVCAHFGTGTLDVSRWMGREGREKGGTPLILADQNVAARCVAMGPPRPMLA